jgi:hypothetical protein
MVRWGYLLDRNFHLMYYQEKQTVTMRLARLRSPPQMKCTYAYTNIVPVGSLQSEERGTFCWNSEGGTRSPLLSATLLPVVIDLTSKTVPKLCQLFQSCQRHNMDIYPNWFLKFSDTQFLIFPVWDRSISKCNSCGDNSLGVLAIRHLASSARQSSAREVYYSFEDGWVLGWVWVGWVLVLHSESESPIS